MRRFLTAAIGLILAAILYAGCKKDGTSVNNSEFIGVWTMTSFDDGLGPRTLANFSCLAGNTLTVTSGKMEAKYVGQTACVVGPTDTHIFGFPGAAATLSTWEKKGNQYVTTITNKAGEIVHGYGTIALSGDKPILTFRDTIPPPVANMPDYIFTFVYVKK